MYIYEGLMLLVTVETTMSIPWADSDLRLEKVAKLFPVRNYLQRGIPHQRLKSNNVHYLMFGGSFLHRMSNILAENAELYKRIQTNDIHKVTLWAIQMRVFTMGRERMNYLK